MTKLHAASYQATNSMADPDAIHPEDSTVSAPNGAWKQTVPALTIEAIGSRTSCAKRNLGCKGGSLGQAHC